MQTKTATLIGFSGLIGNELLDILLETQDYNSIRLLSRKPYTHPNSRVEVVKVDFDDELSFRTGISGSTAVFCMVGTTRAKTKGDMAVYRKVDHDIPVNAAQHCAGTGCPVFVVVSSVGADSKSKNFYLRFKGEMEEKVAEQSTVSLSIFRPSMLLGKRNEFRLGELLAKKLLAPFAFLIPGSYKPVQAKDVARAMLVAAREAKPGSRIIHYSGIKEMARGVKK